MPDETLLPVHVVPLSGGTRLNVRARPEHLDALEAALSVALPRTVRQVTGTPDRFVTCLGPDEWVITSPADQIANVRDLIRGPLQMVPCSVTDISSRELCYRVEGRAAATLLNSGCPANLKAMPVPSAARTVFEGVQISLVKWSEETFRLEVWRSFAPHIMACLDLALRDVLEVSVSGTEPQSSGAAAFEKPLEA